MTTDPRKKARTAGHTPEEPPRGPSSWPSRTPTEGIEVARILQHASAPPLPKDKTPTLNERRPRELEEALALEAAGLLPAEPPYREPKALRVQRAGVPDLIIPLYPDRSYLFGRAPESTVFFGSDTVSRQHGNLFFRQDHRWVYRDLNSRNHSFLGRNDTPVIGDARRSFQPMTASQDWVLEAGHVVLLGNEQSRIVLLPEVPEGLVAGARPQHSPSPARRRIEREIDLCAHHSLPVFLLGQSGTGKTFIAREIHRRSRQDGNFVILNCGRLPQDPSMLHSELLGHTKAAYNGALARVGKFYGANGGTLFLDEVEFLPRVAQDFLIDVLEGSGSFAPLGAPADFREPPPRFRLISASKTPLHQTGLRPDLAQRLATGAVIVLPTLEERREDIPELVRDFLHQLQAEQQCDAELTPDAIAYLQQVDWPGQIRALEATVKAVVAQEAAARAIDGLRPQRLVISLEAVRTHLAQRQLGFGGAEAVSASPLPAVPTSSGEAPPVRKRPSDLTGPEVRAALTRHQGNKTRTAQELGIALNTLKTLMKKFGVA